MRMSISKIPASPKNYPDEYERRFRVGGARPTSVEDVGLAELARKLAPVCRSPEAQAVSEYDQWGAAPIEAATTRSAIDFVRSKPGGPARRDLEATQISGFAVPCSRDLRYPIRRRVGAQDAGQGRSRPQARRCCSGPRCLLRFSCPKEARPEREATSRSRPSSRSWGLGNCRRLFMLTPRLLPPPCRRPRSRRRTAWRRRRLSRRRPRRRSRRS